MGVFEKIGNHDSDQTVLEELGRRLARSRLNRNQSQADLAKEAGISLRTLHRIEHGQSTHLTNLIRLLRALDLLENLESLVPAPGPSPMQLLAMGGKERRRASTPTEEADETEQPWSWGDEE